MPTAPPSAANEGTAAAERQAGEPGIKAATEDMWGEGYWKGKWWCPWFCQEEEREKRRERRRRRAALNELKRERDAEMKKADVQIVSRTFDGGQSSA